MKTMFLAAFALSFAVLADEAATQKPAAHKMKPAPVMLNSGDLKWGEAPPNLPKGAQLAVLFGDPGAKGQFTLRLKLPDGYRIPPHWHTSDEQLTVVSGTFILHAGDTMDAPAHSMDAGGFHFLPGKMHHAAETKGETVLELHSMGPFDIHYLNPADDPSKAAAMAK
jgi:quercetin dioxygenase-like cupin family protein